MVNDKQHTFDHLPCCCQQQSSPSTSSSHFHTVGDFLAGLSVLGIQVVSVRNHKALPQKPIKNNLVLNAIEKDGKSVPN